MDSRLILLPVLAIALAGTPVNASAQDGAEQEAGGDDGRAIEFHAVLKNLYLFRSDSDFDPSAPK